MKTKKNHPRKYQCIHCKAVYVTARSVHSHVTKKHRRKLPQENVDWKYIWPVRDDKAGVQGLPKAVTNRPLTLLDDLAVAPPELHQAYGALLDDMLIKNAKEVAEMFLKNPNFENYLVMVSWVKTAEALRQNRHESAYVPTPTGGITKYGWPLTPKSDVIKEVADVNGLPVKEAKPAECDEQDFKGLPKLASIEEYFHRRVVEDLDVQCSPGGEIYSRPFVVNILGTNIPMVLKFTINIHDIRPNSEA